MYLFDSHCHLDDRQYRKDFERIISRARLAGVVKMLTVGIDPQTSEKAVSLAQSHTGIYASVGIHPHNARFCSAAMLEQLGRLARHAKVRAWGEIGLDFNRMFSPRRNQEDCFMRQLSMADQLNLPVIFHERDSRGRFIEILKAHRSSKRKGVVHCFSGSRRELQHYLDLDYCIGITGILTMKERGAQLRSQIQYIPAGRLLIETDAPYLTPVPQKNKTRRNEPSFVRSVLFRLAEVRGQEPGELADIIWSNTCRLYGIDSDVSGRAGAIPRMDSAN